MNRYVVVETVKVSFSHEVVANSEREAIEFVRQGDAPPFSDGDFLWESAEYGVDDL